MSFDEIIAIAKFRRAEDSKLAAIRHQRQLAGEILAGWMYHGFDLTEKEHNFVVRCNRAMKPIDAPTLSALGKINERRWTK